MGSIYPSLYKFDFGIITFKQIKRNMVKMMKNIYFQLIYLLLLLFVFCVGLGLDMCVKFEKTFQLFIFFE